jgi:carboxysome shell carbonic anhydrase
MRSAHAYDPAPRAAALDSAAATHPLAEPAASAALQARADEIDAAFTAIEPAVRAVAARQFEDHFVSTAFDMLRERLGLLVPLNHLQASWSAPLDVSGLYAHCVLATFARLIEHRVAHGAQPEDAADAPQLIHQWGFHAVDVTPCADGRLAGVLDHILRIPPAVIAYRKSYAGALFDVEESLRHWEAVELRRWREASPNRADAPTQYLKIGVYHFSSVAPTQEGCAAHGSDDARAAGALLERLVQFQQAVANTQCCAARAAVLLVGVDTDTDAIRVHVPDARGTASVERLVDASRLHELTRDMSRDAAKDAIRAAVAACAGVDPADPATEGMRWFCGYLLKNNIAQVDAVRRRHGAGYADPGHTERLIVVGDAIDAVQLRNLAFQAQMDTLEEGAADLDVGIRILAHLHAPKHLAVPVLVNFRYDPRIPGARQRAELRAQRMQAAIEARFAPSLGRGGLHVHAAVRSGHSDPLENVAAAAAAPDFDITHAGSPA